MLIWLRQDPAAQAIAEIPGVRLLTATAAVATMGDAKAFRSGHEFAAYIGLISGETRSAGKVKPLGISNCGDTYLRTLLIQSARSVQNSPKTPDARLQQLSARKQFNVVTVALTNKMVRTIEAILAHIRAYEREHVSLQPGAAAT